MLLLATCKENEIYPVVPSIKFKDAYVLFDVNGDDSLIVLTITYKDGDGDIGLEDADTMPPFNFVGSPSNPKKNINTYYNNMYIDYYDYINGAYQPAITDLSNDTLRPSMRVPSLTPEGHHKAIRGDIEVRIFPSYATVSSDTVKLMVRIYDRALHESNIIETPDIYLYKRD
jgi:hypothetical protein